MIGVDTNVIIRFLTQDDPKQSSLANAFFESLTADAPGFIAREVMVEVVWVLERAYKLPLERIVAAIEGLLSARELVVETADCTGRALGLYREGQAGFADAMIILGCLDAGASRVVTFDRKAAGIAGGQLLG